MSVEIPARQISCCELPGPYRCRISSLLNVENREKVADVLEREMDFVIHDWMGMVEKQEDLMHISLNRDERTDHLPQLIRDVIARLRWMSGQRPLSQPGRNPSAREKGAGLEIPLSVSASAISWVTGVRTGGLNRTPTKPFSNDAT